ncbi:pleckstrin homology domain-containing family A member 2 isoform X2 [Hyla sarda]|uniref:pleckstrin homology domain-containing family A member 2 isoform X2 n=1 Tax=Hyla sarda TaxID=327740 RepID=UPI0024C2B822|nr:pleckstrin homology domain-containing family A member 2 isoform X2 [Hyla sarda]
MPYVDRKNRTCGFLDIEDGDSGRFLRRYFILDTQANHLIWYMDNPQNLPRGAGAVGSLKLTYISKVPRPGSAQTPEIGSTGSGSQEKKSQTAYKTEIIGGVVVQTPINQNGNECPEVFQPEVFPHTTLRRSQSLMPQHLHKPSSSVCALKSGYCVKQGNMRKNWKRRFFVLSSLSISYYKCETDREPLRCIHLREILKTHECLVKSGDLLMRDNLFEIITAPRIFYIQTDSPQEMHSWIKAINAAIQTLWTRCRDPFGRMSLHRTSIPASSPASAHSLPPCDVKRPLGKSMSIKSSWQPWTPVPKCEKASIGEETLGGSREGEFGVRARHMSEPQRLKDEPFLFNLDNINIRTSDV